MWTNSMIRWRVGRRRPSAKDPGIRTWIAAGALLLGAVLVVIGVVVFLANQI